jgi:membrane fusion protein (multidrug efflux system)
MRSQFNPGKGKVTRCVLLALAIVGAARAQTYEVRGLTEPVNDVVLSVTTPGVISTISHSEGEFIAAGAILLELNSRAEQLEVERKRVQLDTLSAELDRSELLFKNSRSVPKEELDRKRAEVSVAKVELGQSEEALARRRVVAPFAGIVTLVTVKVGEYCELGKQVARVVDSREFFAVSNVDPTRVGALKPGHPVEITVQSGDAMLTLPGQIVFVAPVVDQASGLLRVKARFANAEQRVRPGVAGQLKIPVAHVSRN